MAKGTTNKNKKIQNAKTSIGSPSKKKASWPVLPNREEGERYIFPLSQFTPSDYGDSGSSSEEEVSRTKETASIPSSPKKKIINSVDCKALQENIRNLPWDTSRFQSFNSWKTALQKFWNEKFSEISEYDMLYRVYMEQETHTLHIVNYLEKHRTHYQLYVGSYIEKHKEFLHPDITEKRFEPFLPKMAGQQEKGEGKKEPASPQHINTSNKRVKHWSLSLEKIQAGQKVLEECVDTKKVHRPCIPFWRGIKKRDSLVLKPHTATTTCWTEAISPSQDETSMENSRTRSQPISLHGREKNASQAVASSQGNNRHR